MVKVRLLPSCSGEASRQLQSGELKKAMEFKPVCALAIRVR